MYTLYVCFLFYAHIRTKNEDKRRGNSREEIRPSTRLAN